MPDHQAAHRAEPIAIVGLACRFPDAGDPAELLDLVLSQRRAFRRLPPGRISLAPDAMAGLVAGSGIAAAASDMADRGDVPAPRAAPACGGEPDAGATPAAATTGAAADSAPGAAATPGTGATPAVVPGAGTGPDGIVPYPAARAALIEGWRFDRAAFGVTRTAYQATDPAHWLALETAARALADGGFPGGQGLPRDRTGVIVGNTLTGEVSRAASLRSRWPYVRQVITSALTDERIGAAEQAMLLQRAEARFLASFPEPGEETLAGSLPSVIADRICGYFGFRGGGHAVDSAHSSSLLAVAAACSALATGDLDAVVAGGVDISLDPFELAGLAGMGVLADREMRVYDARPTGFWPGEGCGMVVLMRAADARAAGLPVYAQIAGWGTSSAGNPALTRPGSGSLLLALRRAYQRAGVDPADVQFIEGDGTGTASGDLAELTSLAEIRNAAVTMAAIGSIKANFGHTKAAAGVAGLIKATLVTATGVIPPMTGCARPHQLIASEEARLRVPRAPELWPAGTRLAAVSAIGPGGTSVHLVLRRDTGSGPRRRVRLPGGYLTAGGARAHGRRTGNPAADTAMPAALWQPAAGQPPAAQPAAGRPAATGPAGTFPGRTGLPAPVPAAPWSPVGSRPAIATPAPPPSVETFVFSGGVRDAVAAELTRVAAMAPWLSDAELHDLACHLGNRSAGTGPIRVALVAGSQDELAHRAGHALTLLPGLRPGRLVTAPGTYAADAARGRVTLLFPGDEATMAHPDGLAAGETPRCDPAIHPATLTASLAALHLLERLGVTASAGVGHGFGEITGLVWAGCLSEPDAVRLVAERSVLLGDVAAERAALVCIQADAPAALTLCTGTGLAIAAYNGPSCQILAGPAAAARDLVQRASASGIGAYLIEAPLALHTPALADRTAPLRIMLREFGFRPAARRLISTVTGQELAGRDDLPALLCTQLASPVRFTTALSLAAAEADLLVETGPSQALCRLAPGACDVPAVSVGRPDSQATAEATAALFAVGAARSLAALYAARTARPFDIWRDQLFITNPCERATPPADAGLALTGSPLPAATPAEPAATQTGPAVTPAGEAAEGTGPALPGPSPSPSTGAASCADQPAADPDRGSAGAGAEPPVPAADNPAPGTEADRADRALRCFIGELRQPAEPLPMEPAGPWRVRAVHQPAGETARRVFEHDPKAGAVLAVPGDLADPEAWTVLLNGVREAAETGRLIVITASAGLSRFSECLHAEQPSLGVTLIQTASGVPGLRAARRYAIAEPGRLRELVLDDEGTPREPVMAEADPDGGGTYPLGPADVILVSGMTRAEDLACAGALAYRGAALAVLCQPGADEDPLLSACLENLAATGRRVWCETADPTDAAAVAAAIAELESTLGRVTAVVHAYQPGPPLPCHQLSGSVVSHHVSGQVTRLARVLDALEGTRLRLLVTFGTSLAGDDRSGSCLAALASEAVADYAARRSARLADCRALHVAWPPWPTGGIPAAADTAAGIRERSRLLWRLLATPDLPWHVTVQERAELPAAAGPRDAPEAPATGKAMPAGESPATGEPPAAQETVAGAENASVTGPSGRFVEKILVNEPGVELVAEARLSLPSDPYLADYQVDGLPVLPAVLALEALAEAASALAGQPLRSASRVSLAVPVVMSGAAGEAAAIIRLHARRRGDLLETVLRCSVTGFRVDHARALFRSAEPGVSASPTPARPAPATGGEQPGPAQERPRDTAPAAAGSGGDADGGQRPATRRSSQLSAIRPEGVPAGGIVDGTDLYGPVCFQSGRFRRLAFLPEVTSRSCRALVRGGDDQPWFGPLTGQAGVPLILGSPGLNDAALHVLQACLPHRRVLPAGCESVMFSGQELRGALQVHAVRRAAGSTGAHRRPEVPPPPAVPRAADPHDPPLAGAPRAAGPSDADDACGVWDVIAVDATGEPVVAWVGVRLRDLGPLARTAGWHPALLAVSLEGRAIELGLDASLRVTISTGRPLKHGAGPTPRGGGAAYAQTATGAGHSGADDSGADRSAADRGGAGQGESSLAVLPEPSERERLVWTDLAPGSGPLEGFELRVRASVPVAARWEAVGPAPDDVGILPEPGLTRLRQQLLARPHETAASVDARLRAISASLAALGGQGGQAMTITSDHDSGWIVLRAGRTLLTSTVVEISGTPGATAVAIAATLPLADADAPAPPDACGEPQTLRANGLS